MKKITYSKSGVNYLQLDAAKKIAQNSAKKTSQYLQKVSMREIPETRGESAFVWKQDNVLMATVTESLGTKNLVADQMRKITGKTYYDVIGNDTVAAIINDLTAVGAKPLVITALWAVGQSAWFEDQMRIKDLTDGWRSACDLAEVTWGGGESPAYSDIVSKETIALAGSAVGIVKSQNRLALGKNIKAGDRILLLKSNGINANGISLTRAIAKKLPNGYATKLPSGKMFGDAILTKTNIYAKLIQNLQDAGIDIHYISNITGHGLRKIMRAEEKFTYVIEKLFDPQEIFLFIQKNAGFSDYDAYETYNMGQDYAIFLPAKDIKAAQEIIKKNKFESLDAGFVKKGTRQVVIKPKNITFKGETLDLR